MILNAFMILILQMPGKRETKTEYVLLPRKTLAA